ncbi:MAG: YncE family protein [Nitrospirota bacterium]|nr:YncE family protein [Nitrospirota bacterium]
MKREINILFWIVFFFLSLWFAGCASVAETGKAPDEQYKSQITLFLNGPERTSENITFDLNAVNIVAEDGTSREVMAKPLNVNSLDVTGRQILLGERFIPEGRYRKIEIVVKKASVTRKNGSADLALPPEGIELPIDINVHPRQSISLFLSWSPDSSVSEGYLFKPLLIVKQEMPELRTLLVYVTNEGSGNVYVINRQLGEVVGTVLVGKSPRGIAVNPRKERLKVYVANSGSNSISVIDPNTNTVESEIPVRFGKEPEAIAVARVSHEKDLIFVANFGSNNVSIIDASTLQEIDKVAVGDGPVAIASDPPFESLSGTRFLSNSEINALRNYRERYLNVYVANKNSKSVSVLKIDVQSMRCEEVIPFEVQWEPISLSVDYLRGKVYVANNSFDDLSVISIPAIVRGNTAGAVSAIKNVGPSVIGVFSDPDFERIYLLKEMPGEIVVLRLSEGVTPAAQPVMPPVMGIIPVGISPRAFMLDPEGRKIYVVNRGENSVMVIDKTTRQRVRVIPAGKRPYGLDLFTR